MTFHLPFIRHKPAMHTITKRDYFSNILHDILNECNALPATFSTNGERDLLPRIDVSETDTTYCLEVELPGIDANHIELKIDNHMLTIRGHREETSESKDKHYHMRERYIGTFQRSITLPNNIFEENIDAQFEKGILYVKIPKLEQGKAKRIEIKY